MEPVWLDGAFKWTAEAGGMSSDSQRCRVGRDGDALLIDGRGMLTRIPFSDITYVKERKAGLLARAVEFQTSAGTTITIQETRRSYVGLVTGWIALEMESEPK